MPIPTDPRTPKERVTEQLRLARMQLTKPGLSRAGRARVADRIHELIEEAKRLGL